MTRFGIFSALALALTSLSAQPALAEPEVTVSEASDPAMNAAKARAQQTLAEFWRHFENPAADETTFLIKFNLTPDGDAEFIWANMLERAGGKIFGHLANEPLDQRFTAGQRLEIREADIVDWGYFKNGVMQGNFTTRVQLDQLPEEQAAQIRAGLGW